MGAEGIRRVMSYLAHSDARRYERIARTQSNVVLEQVLFLAAMTGTAGGVRARRFERRSAIEGRR
jgi:hypothetical protein